MNGNLDSVQIVEKEMGITHRDFYKDLPNLLDGIPYRQDDDTIKFQINNKTIEISLGPERVRELGLSFRLPVTPVTLRFFEFSEEEMSEFIKHFNLKFMKGGG